MPTDRLARLLVVIGAALIVAGVLVWLASKLGLGRLPGDIRIERGPITCIFPLATSVLLSIVLTIVINLIMRILRK